MSDDIKVTEVKNITILIGDGVHPDHSGDIMCAEGWEEFLDRIPVTMGMSGNTKYPYDGVVGHALLTRAGPRIKADFTIHDGMPGLPEQCLKYLSPAISGFILQRNGDRVVKFKITSIGLVPAGRNSDSRIGTMAGDK